MSFHIQGKQLQSSFCQDYANELSSISLCTTLRKVTELFYNFPPGDLCPAWRDLSVRETFCIGHLWQCKVRICHYLCPLLCRLHRLQAILGYGIILQLISIFYIYLTSVPGVAGGRVRSSSVRHASTGAIVLIYLSGCRMGSRLELESTPDQCRDLPSSNAKSGHEHGHVFPLCESERKLKGRRPSRAKPSQCTIANATQAVQVMQVEEAPRKPPVLLRGNPYRSCLGIVLPPRDC